MQRLSPVSKRNQRKAKYSFLLVYCLALFLYADVADMGSAFIIIGNDIAELGKPMEMSEKAVLIDNIVKNVLGRCKSIQAVLPVIKESPKPVLLLDMVEIMLEVVLPETAPTC